MYQNPLRRIQTRHTTKRPDNISKSDKQALFQPKDWREYANCKGKSDKMFPRHHKDISYITEARRICRGCPVKEECLMDALEWPTTDMHGVWAGMTQRQLAQEQKKRGITPSRPTIAAMWAAFAKEENRDE